MASDTGARPRRSLWILAILLAMFAALVGYQVFGGSATSGAVTSNGSGRAPGEEEAGGAPPPAVRLEALAPGEGDAPDAGRNPFRFQPRAPARPAPSPNAASAGPAPVAGAPVTSRPATSAAPPIPLKFIGTVAVPGAGTIAALSDGTFVYHGREGEVIDGRYRIVKIGVESIVIEHVDGRGRQTIRLTG